MWLLFEKLAMNLDRVDTITIDQGGVVVACGNQNWLIKKGGRLRLVDPGQMMAEFLRPEIEGVPFDGLTFDNVRAESSAAVDTDAKV